MPERTQYIQLGAPIKGLWWCGIVLLAIFWQTDLRGQSMVMITGAVLDADEHGPLPAVHVWVNHSTLGTVTNLNGHFVILMNKGDTLNFSSIGYSNAMFILSDKVEKEHYTLLQLLRKDTLLLDEVVVFPWPEWEDFKKAFLSKSNTHLARKTFNPSEIKQEHLKSESALSKYSHTQLRYQQLYDLNGIIPPNNFLNPINWSNFIYDLQQHLKSKKYEKN